MGGTLVVQEKRSVVDKFRNWYGEKIVDSHISENFEKMYAKKVEIYKKIGEFKKVVCSAALLFIPEASFLIPFIEPLVNFGNKLSDVELAAVVGTKRMIESKFIGVDGSCKDVQIPELHVEEIVDDATSLATDAVTVIQEDPSIITGKVSGGATK